MDIQFNSDKKELAKIGILDIYIKRKLKDYYSKLFIEFFGSLKIKI